VLEVVRQRLLTPWGLRSLAPGEPDYKPTYHGDLRSRDAAYHQGTVWPWLIGPFIDAWLKVHPDDRTGGRGFLQGLADHLGCRRGRGSTCPCCRERIRGPFATVLIYQAGNTEPSLAAARRGNVFLRSALFAAASAAVRTKGSYYRDKYNRLRARRGPVRALIAIAHKLLIAAVHMLTTGEGFRDLGESHLDQVARKRSTTKLVQRLCNLGYDVMLMPKAA